MKAWKSGLLIAVLWGVSAFAQAGLPPDKEAVVRDFVAVDKPIPIKLGGAPLVGDIAPNGIELLPLGGIAGRVPEIAKLKYFLADKNVIVLVNPDNREITYVIK